jgi:hypothetical protein
MHWTHTIPPSIHATCLYVPTSGSYTRKLEWSPQSSRYGPNKNWCQTWGVRCEYIWEILAAEWHKQPSPYKVMYGIILRTPQIRTYDAHTVSYFSSLFPPCSDMTVYVFWNGASSSTRGVVGLSVTTRSTQIYHLALVHRSVKLLLFLASTVILDFRSRRNLWARLLFSPRHIRV